MGGLGFLLKNHSAKDNGKRGRISSLAFVLILLIIPGILLSGCGRKTMPRPLTSEPPPQIQDLSSRVVDEGVELSWSIPGYDLHTLPDAPYQFSLVRGKIPWEDRQCKDCPIAAKEEVFRLDPAYPRSVDLRAAGRVVWKDSAVSPLTAYRYQIVVLDARGHHLALSNITSAAVIPPPAPPSGITALGGPQGIFLEWRENRRDAEGNPLKGELRYQVERKSQGEQWRVLSSTPVVGETFLDSAPAPSHFYSYRITPIVLFEQSDVYGAPAIVENIKAPEALPPPPPATVWVIPSQGALEVQWTPSEGQNAGYHVYRREGSEIIRLTASPVVRPPFRDRNIKPNVIYGYAVSTVSHPPDQKEGLLSKWTEIRSVLLE